MISRIACLLALLWGVCCATSSAVEYPTGKLVIADYQGGRATRTIGDSPGIWTYDGNALQSSVAAKRRVSNSDLLDANGRNQLAAMVYPAVGMQSQEDEVYLEYQILLAKAARIDGFVVEWARPGDPSFLKMQSVAQRLGFYVGANWCVSQTLRWDVADWEANTLKTTATQQQKLEFGYDYARRLRAELYDKPTGLKLNGHPLLLIFGGDFFANADMPQLRVEWGEGASPLIGRYLLGLPDTYAAGIFRQAANLLDGFYPWSGSGIPETSATDDELAPLMAVPTHDSFYSADNLLSYRERWIGYTKNFSDKGLPLRMGCVMPGADNRACGGWGTKIFYIERKNGETHRRQWELYARERDNLHLVLVGTWNDFTEDTAVEPTLERGMRDVEIAEAGSAAFKGEASDPSGLPLPKRLFDLRKGYGQLVRLGFGALGPTDRMDKIALQIAGRQYAAAALALAEEETRLAALLARVVSQPTLTTVLVDSATEKSVAAGGNLWLTLTSSVDALISTLRCDMELSWEWLDTETTSYSVLASTGTATDTVAQIIGTGTGNWISARIKVFDENCPFARDGVTTSGKANFRFSGKVKCRNVVLKTVRKDLPLSVSLGPVGGEVLEGGTLRLAIEAGATGGVSYQWRKDGVNLSGKTGAVLDVTPFSASDAGRYACVVSSGPANVTSADALVTLAVAPSIASQPESLLLNQGSSALLSVSASGSAPLQYQWRKNGAPIAGATGATFEIASVSQADVGHYDVVVSNAAGSVTSAEAVLALNNAPVIIGQPVGSVVSVGGVKTFNVVVSGAGPFTYQWFRGRVAIEGGTSASYTISETRLLDAGTYSVRVSNPVGETVSAGAELAVLRPPILLAGPVSSTVSAGAGVSLSVTALSFAPLSYQWMKDGVAILGGTSSILSLSNVSSLNAGSYEVLISNGAGTLAPSPGATLSVNEPPIIAAHPVGGTLHLGENMTLAVSVGPGVASPISYQWRKDGLMIPGASHNQLTLSAGSQTAGVYDVVVSNPAGSLVSRTARVDVSVPPVIIHDPLSADVTAGSQLSLSVKAEGGASLSYQWYKNERPIASQTSAVLSITGTTIEDAGEYCVKVTGSGTVVCSASATVRVDTGGFAVLRQPVDVVRLYGTAPKVVVQVAAEPSSVTSYQLCAVTEGSLVAVPSVRGIVPATTGLVEIALGNLRNAEGLYVLNFKRFTDVGEVNAYTQSFNLAGRSWEDGAGTYQALLKDTQGTAPITDGASFRGMVTLSVTRTGMVSGNVQYNEAPLLAGTSDATLRAYRPVGRFFVGRFSPSDDNPLQLKCAPKLSLAGGTSNLSLSLELDLSGSRAALTATVKDIGSVASGSLDLGYAKSQMERTVKACSALAAEWEGVAGAYIASVNAGEAALDSNKNGSVRLQVLPSGRVLWGSRLKGYTGTGSSYLSAPDSMNLAAVLYERQVKSSPNSWAFTSILGALNWTKNYVGEWSLSLGTDESPDQFEGQSTRFNGSRDAGGLKWTGVTRMSTSDGDVCRWNATTIPTLLPLGTPLYITVKDSGSQTGSYVWRVEPSVLGRPLTSGVSSGGENPPPLLLNFDRSRGTWSGSYSVAGLRRVLNGVALSGAGIRGRGWIEAGNATEMSTGRWELFTAE